MSTLLILALCMCRQTPEQVRPARQRRMRQQSGHVSDRHSGAGSTSRRAAPLPVQREQILPGAARRAPAAIGEASSGLPTAAAATARQPQQRTGMTAAGDFPLQNHGEAQHEAAAPNPEVNGTGNGDNRDPPGSTRNGAARRGRSRAAPAAVGGSEPIEDAEDVCCERAQSARAQDKREKDAASPASVQHAPASRHTAEPAGNATSAAAAALSEHAQACTGEANAAAEQQASPQLATIQDGASQGPRHSPTNHGQQHRQAAAARASSVLAQRDVAEGVSEVAVASGPAGLPSEPRTRSGLPLPRAHARPALSQQREPYAPFPVCVITTPTG